MRASNCQRFEAKLKHQKPPLQQSQIINQSTGQGPSSYLQLSAGLMMLVLIAIARQ